LTLGDFRRYNPFHGDRTNDARPALVVALLLNG